MLFRLHVAVLLLASMPAMAQDGPPATIRIDGRTDVEAEAGTVASVPLRLTNMGSNAVTVRLEPDLPDGWSLLIPLPEVTITAGATASQLVSLQIPAGARSGAWPVRFRLSAGDAHHDVDVRVAERPGVALAPLDAPDRIRAGAILEAAFTVENTGNVSIQVLLVPTSTLSYESAVSERVVLLEPGSRVEVGVRVETRDDLVNEVTHVVGLQARVVGSDIGARASALTAIVPVHRARPQRREGYLPAFITFSGVTDNGTPHGQVEVEIPEVTSGNATVSALLRAPDVRSSSTVGERDVYAASVQWPRLGVRAGDQAYRVSDLLDNVSMGTGAEVTWTTGTVDSGIFAARSRHLFPETDRVGGFVHVRPFKRLLLEANSLVRRQFEEGNAVSMALGWTPVDGTILRGEVAAGSFDQGWDHAVQLTALGSWRRSMFNARAERAGADFLGGIQNSERLMGGLSWNSGGWFRAQVQGNVYRRFFDSGLSNEGVLVTNSLRAGLGGAWSRDGSQWRMMVFGQRMERRFDLSGLDRNELRAEAQVAYNQRRAGLTASFQTGQVEDTVFDLDPFWTAYGSAFRSMGPWSLSVNSTVSSGPTFFSPVTRSRKSVGAGLSYDAGGATRFSTSVYVSEEQSSLNQRFLLADVWVERQVWAGHVMEIRGRWSRAEFGETLQTGSVHVAYRVPFFVPTPGRGAGASRTIEIFVFDAETGSPMVGAEFTLDQTTIQTGADGKVRLTVRTATPSFLLLNRLTIGLERMPVLEFPLEIGDTWQDGETLDIAVVRSARLRVPVSISDGQAGVTDVAREERLDETDLTGLVVEARSKDSRVRRVTDRSGTATFPALVPGEWQVHVVPTTLPTGYVTRPDTVVVLLSAGAQSDAPLALVPKRRSIRFVDTGAPISLARQHVVSANETLFSIARRYYTSPYHWIRIWNANSAAIPDPDVLPIGTLLHLPENGPLTEAERTQILSLRR